MKGISAELEKYRVHEGPWRSWPGERSGAFFLPGPKGQELKVLVSVGDDDVPWEHVSVSLRNRCPNWEEMCFVKDLFWRDEDAVMQLHPRRSEYVNNHPFCLHLWRPLDGKIPEPPKGAV